MGNSINTGYQTSVTKDSTVAAKAGVAVYKCEIGCMLVSVTR